MIRACESPWGRVSRPGGGKKGGRRSPLQSRENRKDGALVWKPRLNGRDQNLVTSLKWKSRTFMGGTTISKDSSPAERTAGPSASTEASISIML